MKIASVTGVTEKDLEVKVPISAIMPHITNNSAEWNLEKMEVWLRKNTGDDIQLMPPTLIKKIIEGNLKDEHVAFQNLGDSYGLILLTGDKDVALDIPVEDNGRIEIKLTALTAGTNYDIYGIEAFTKANVYQKVTTKRKMTDQVEKMSVLGLTHGIFPLTSLTSIRFIKDGESYTRTKTEIQKLSALEGEVKQVRNVRLTLDGNAQNIDVDLSNMFEEQEYLMIDFDGIDMIELDAAADYEWQAGFITEY